MKFTTSSSNLLHIINKCLPVVASNPVLPILEDFRFDLNGNNLKITATNLEITISSSIDVSGEVDGVMCVSAKDLSQLVKNIPDQPIKFIMENRNLTIESSVGVYEFPCSDHNEYPNTDKVDGNEISVTDDFIHAIGSVSFCAGVDEQRKAMTGISLNCINNTIELCATDAHQLALFKVDTEESEDFKIILPRSVANLILKVYKSGDITISRNEKSISFLINDIYIVSRLIDARYPDYNAVIPIENPNVVTIDRKSLLGSLKRLLTFSGDEHNQAIFSLDNNNLHISSSDEKKAKKAIESIDCEYQGSPMTIGINALSMVDVLNKITTNQVIINMSTPQRAMIIDAGENDIYLLMPVFTP